MSIPPKAQRNDGGRAPSSDITNKLRQLAIGESVIGPRRWESVAYTKAKRLGITITCRRPEGDQDLVAVYRTS